MRICIPTILVLLLSSSFASAATGVEKYIARLQDGYPRPVYTVHGPNECYIDSQDMDWIPATIRVNVSGFGSYGELAKVKVSPNEISWKFKSIRESKSVTIKVDDDGNVLSGKVVWRQLWEVQTSYCEIKQ
ncbi:hypothetical protein [Bdellovibrio sp. HCB209]|uniref:hypothetical protein n=1 Tax=Bdellovibrio sp. HCB209 TaxID=3394354 RepID=UPI0039B6E24A